LLSYDALPYASPAPMERDIHYLQYKYGGHFEYVDSFTIYWDKPKYVLPYDEFDILLADQILEKRDCELWKIIK
jgi:hypothetical protein